MPVRDELDEEEAGRYRPFWSGTITFGLVTVPVELMPAVRTERTALRMVSEAGVPLNRGYFSTRDDKPLEWDDIVRGFEVTRDRFVVVEDDELTKLAPDRSRDIDLRLFVDASGLDPMLFSRAWYLTPAGDSSKAYRLLARVMEESSRAGIATFVMRGREYLVAITADHGVLRAQMLRFTEEIRSPEEAGLPAPDNPPRDEVTRFERRIRAMKAARLDTAELNNPESKRMWALARRKKKAGRDVHRQRGLEATSGVIDLMDRLQKSLAGK
ncbi:MAG: Ku protein [Gemmatimonadota bacterium]|jgi:DNA end-binding protein Ku|nr:Ku protein [Gemmatimonadota bacterium]